MSVIKRLHLIHKQFEIPYIIGSWSNRFRRRRSKYIAYMIEECYNRKKEVNIIDIGGKKSYWDIFSDTFLSENNVHITILNLPSNSPLPEKDKIFTYIYGDGCNLSEFSDKSFHIAHSNSTLEHVGNMENKRKFSNEIQRVGEKHYLQTPNYWFPIEPHFLVPFFQFLPLPVRIKLLCIFDIGHWKRVRNSQIAKLVLEYTDLLSKNDLIQLFPDSSIIKEKFWFLTKSFIVIGNS